MSFLTSAKEVIQQRQNIQKKKEKQKATDEKKLIQDIPNRLLQFLERGKMHNVCQLIAEFHGIEVDLDAHDYFKEIISFHNQIGYIKKTLVNKLGLFYERPGYSSVELDIHETETLAVEFLGIFDLSIYFVPYQDEKDGFSCVVFAPFSTGINFLDDIPSIIARDWVVDYLKKHPDLVTN